MPPHALRSTVHTLLDAGGRELRHALRGLRRQPIFTLSVIGILATVIGGGVAVFGVLYPLLLRPLPYRDADRLIVIDAERQYAQALKPVPARFRLADQAVWRDHLRSTESVALYLTDTVVLVDAFGPRIVTGAIVSDGFFSTIGAGFNVGRPLGPAERLRPAVVVSDRLARQLAGASSRALGSQLRINSRAYEIVGVAPVTFALPAENVDVWIGAEYEQSVEPRAASFGVLARARASVDRTGVQADVDQAVAAAARDDPAIFGNALRATVVPLRDKVVGDVRPTLIVLGLAASLIFIVACANVAGLFLGRGAGLARECAIQLALGASRLRLFMRRLIDAAILAAAGTAAGLFVAGWLIALLAWLKPAGVPQLPSGIDAAGWGFAAALWALVTVLLAMVPAVPRLQAKDVTIGVRGPSTGVRRLGRVLSVTEFGLATVLMVGAILLSRTLVELLRTDIGATTGHVTVVSMRPAQRQARRDADAIAFAERATARLQAVPGIVAVGVGSSVPPRSGGLTLTLKREGDAVDYAATGVVATPGYFDALRIRLIKGRAFGPQDAEDAPPVIIVSEPTARRLFGMDDAIGRTIGMPTLRDGQKGSADMTVVGVIAPVKYSGIAEEADEQVYRPFAQQPWSAFSLIIRTDRDMPELAGALRSLLTELDPSLAVVSSYSLDQAVADDTAASRLRSALVSAIAVVGVVLAASGLFGLVAYSVSQRTSEIGVRVAIGATPADIHRLIVREGLIIAAAGVAIGLVAAWVMARSLATVVYRVDVHDPVSLAVTAAVLLVVALVASYVPARRASRVDPLVALRAD